MNSIVRSLLILAAIGSLAIILICASDDAEALDCVQNKVNFDPDEVTVYYGGSQVDPLTDIVAGFSIFVSEKTGYCNVTINGEPYVPDPFGHIILASEVESGILIQAEKIQYTICFDSTIQNIGELPESIDGITIGSGTSIPSADLSRTGYRLDGWNTSPDGTGDSFQPGNLTIDADFITDHFSQTTLTLYPKWVLKEYSISFNANSGTGQTPQTISGKTLGAEITIPAVGITRVGYSASVWNTSSNGNGQNVSSDTLTMDADFIETYFGNNTAITLYPKWVEIEYTIRFDTTYVITGTLPSPISGITIGSSVNVQSAVLSRTGYTLNGWNTSPDGSGDDLQSRSYTVDADFITDHFGQTTLTLYPKWIPKQYTISFNVNSGTGQLPSAISNKSIGTEIDIPAVEITRVGYSSAVWNTSPNGSGYDFTARHLTIDASFISTYFGEGTSITLYPKWVEINYSITFSTAYGETGTIPDPVQNITIGSTVTIQSPVLTRIGYILNGWNTTPNGTGDDLQCRSYTFDTDFIIDHFGQSTALTLYPKWIAKEYSLRFNINSGSGQLPQNITNKTIGTEIDIPAVGVTRIGYSATIWNTSPNGSGTDFTPRHLTIDASFITANFGEGTEITLYPKWITISYSINFATTLEIGGNLPNSINNITIGSGTSIPSAVLTRTGYNLNGWNASPDGTGDSFQPGGYNIDEEFITEHFGQSTSLTLYPKWVAKEYTISFNVNLGTGQPPANISNKTIGTEITMPSVGISRIGYTVSLWNTSPYGSGADVSPGLLTMDAGFIESCFGNGTSVILYPKWVAINYSVTFITVYEEPGTIPDPIENITIGSVISIQPPVLTRTGYTLNGWNTSPDGTGDDLQPRNHTIDAEFITDHFGQSTALTLYPKWIAKQYTISFDSNSGVGQLPSAISNKIIGTEIDIPAVGITRIGYTSTVWNTSSNGSGSDFGAGHPTIDAAFISTYFGEGTSITLYPKWTAINYSISFATTMEIVGELPNSINGLTIGSGTVIQSAAISRTGYTLNGWNTSPDGTGDSFQPGSITIDADFITDHYGQSTTLTLYPKWTAKLYSISFNVNSGTGQPPQTISGKIINSEVTIPSVGITRTGYSASVWNTASNGNGLDVSPGLTSINAAFIEAHYGNATAVTLYPKWVAIDYSISFSTVYGETGILPSSVSDITIGSSVNIRSAALSRTGYDMSGWNTSPNGTGADFSAGVYSVDADFITEYYIQSTSLVLYPKWIARQYSITFSINTGTGQLPQAISGKTIGTEIDIPAVGVTKIGYTAAVWNTSPNGSGTDFSPRHLTIDAAFITAHYGEGTSIVLYPKWTVINYSIDFVTTVEINGNLPNRINNLTIGSGTVIPSVILTRIGYDMNGWNTSPDGSGDDLPPGNYAIDADFITDHLSQSTTLTLYPKWIPRQYSLSFDLNSGTGQLPQTIAEKTIGAEITIPVIGITRVGYSASVWNTSSNGNGLNVSPGLMSIDAAFIESRYGNATSVTLYPKWVAIDYSIGFSTVYGETGTVPDLIGDINIDSVVTVRTAVLTRTGYDLDGWNTSSDGTGVDFPAGNHSVNAAFITKHFAQDTSLTLYPKWTPRVYSLSFNINSGTGQLPQNITGRTIGMGLQIPAVGVTRIGYNVTVWNTSPDGTGDDFQPDSYQLDADFITEHYGQSTSITLYPKWIAKQYSVSFNANSGTGQLPQNITGKTIDSELEISSVGITRVGYTATVWSTSPDGDGLNINPGLLSVDAGFISDYYGNRTSIILYPKWIEINYSIVFRSTEGASGQVPDTLNGITIGSGTSIQTVALTRMGYDSDGWNTSEDGSGTDFRPGGYVINADFITNYYTQGTVLTLYPKWVPREYSLSFSRNSGSGQLPQSITGKTIGTELDIPAVGITRIGYTSTVWNTSPDGTGSDIDPRHLTLDASFIEGCFGNNTSVTLYPKWVRIDYSISFLAADDVSGILPTSIGNIEIDSAVTIQSSLLTRIGYDLDGWNTSPDGTGTDIRPRSLTIDADFITGFFGRNTSVTLYPKWIPKEYSVSFDANSGTGQLPQNITGRTIGNAITIPAVGMTRIGYTVSMWNTLPDGTGADIDPRQSTLDADFIGTYFGNDTEITLYPKWNAISYSVSFVTTYEITGTLPSTISNITIGSSVTVQSSVLTRTGYRLDGWNTSSDGTGDDFQPGSYTFDADFITGHYGQDTSMTLYPKWTAKEYSLSFNANSGTGQSPDGIGGKTIDSETTIPSVGVTRIGYTVSLWNTSSDGSGRDLNPGRLTIDSSFIESYYGDDTEITLYPKWNAIAYSIIFDSPAGISGTLPDPITGIIIGSGTSIQSAVLSRTGYSLDGWNTSNDGTGDDLQPGDYIVDADFITNHYGQSTTITLYPKWIQKIYSLSFNYNSGIGQLPQNISGKTIGTETDIPAVGITRIGYSVSTWNTSPDGNGLDLGPKHLTFDAEFIDGYFGSGTDLTLYPKWTAIRYSVSFDSTVEIKGAMPNSLDNITIDSVLTIGSSALSRTGYDLNGWNTSPDGTGEDFQPRDYPVDADFITHHYSQSTSLTLYPKWIAKEYSMSFDSNSGTGQLPNGLNITIISGADIPAVSFTRIGYSSSVWNTSPDGSGTDINPGHLTINSAFIDGHFSDSEMITLYPKWVKNDYSINFDTAEQVTGTMPASLINFRIDSVITIPSVTFSRTGYSVSVWNTSPDGTGRSVGFGELEVDSELIGDIVGDEKVISLYPSWSLNIYSVSLTTERGRPIGWAVRDGSYVSDYSVESADIILPIPEPDDRFHSFANWADADGNAVSVIAAGSTGDVALSAVWIENVYPVTFTINGRVVNVDLTVSSEMPEPEPEDGFRFKGWYYIDEYGNEVRFDSMSQMTENMTVYAVFEPTPDDPVMITVCVVALLAFFGTAMLIVFFRK